MSTLDYILFGSPPVATPGSGSYDDRVIGTGDAFPSFPGLVQYNDLLLNDKGAFDHYHINSIDGLDDAELRDFRSAKPFDDGEDVFGSLYSGRSLAINGEIRAYHVWKTDDMREAMQAAFQVRGGFGLRNPERPLWIRRGNPAKDRLIYCKKNAKLEIPHAQPTRAAPWIPFMVPMRASDPRILSYLLHSYVQEGAGTFSITNEGNYQAKILMRFYGPATTMTLTNSYEAVVQVVEVGPIASGSYVEILGSRVRNQDGSNAYNLYSSDSDRITLGPGPAIANNLQLTGTGMGSSTSLAVQWRDSWV